MIELKAIKKGYDGYIVLSDFSYHFEVGKSYAIVGKSGSGKTTLLNMVGRLEFPDQGEVSLEGKNIQKISEKVYFKDHLGYLFQNYGLIDNESIKANLKLAFVGKKVNPSEQEIQIGLVLQAVGLDDCDQNRKIFSLSGGEAQRVAIAKLIIKNPPIILADEPTGALDETTGKEVMDLLLGLVDKNTLVIIATHDPHVYNRVDEVVNLSYRVSR